MRNILKFKKIKYVRVKYVVCKVYINKYYNLSNILLLKLLQKMTNNCQNRNI